MLKPYRTILRIPGALAFTSIGWFGRLPMSMMGIGLVLLVSAKTGSYAIAGSVSAAYVLAAAIGAPIQARLVDRIGQHRVLPFLAVGYALGIGGTVVVVEVGLRTPVPQLLAACAGLAAAQIGSYVRARWTHLLGNVPELQTAYALEALLDEIVFMVGPPVVTVLATAIDPVAGLATAAVSGVVGAFVLATLRRTEPPAHGRITPGTAKDPLGWRLLTPVIVASVGLGTLFGAAEVVVVAFASEQGARSLSGLLLAVWASGSMLAALILGIVRLKLPAIRRYQIGAFGMAVVMVPLPFIDQLGTLAGVLFLAGFAISPTMIASIGLVQESVPASRLTEGIAWVESALVVGVAAGAAVAGPVIDLHGASAGFFVPLTGGVLAAAGALIGGRFVRRR